MPDQKPNPDAALMEPPKQVMPTEPPAAPAPQSAPPSPVPAAPAAAAPLPSAAPASPAPPAAQPKAEPSKESPKLVSIRYNNQDFQVSPEVAEAWQHRQSAFDDGYKRTLEELNGLKERIPAPPKPAEPTEEERRERLATRLLTEPDKVLAELEESIEKKLVQKYQGDISAREFQAKWWTDNKEILPYRDVFEALMLKNAGGYIKQGLTDAQAYDQNADAVRKLILSIKGNGGANPAQAREHVEEPAPRPSAAPVSEPAGESESMSMTEAMMAHRRRKSEAALRPARPTPAA